jgi:hypothetical protein
MLVFKQLFTFFKSALFHCLSINISFYLETYGIDLIKLFGIPYLQYFVTYIFSKQCLKYCLCLSNENLPWWSKF